MYRQTLYICLFPLLLAGCGDSDGTDSDASATLTTGVVTGATATATPTTSEQTQTVGEAESGSEDASTESSTETDPQTTESETETESDGCICTPGETADCIDDGSIEVCADDCQSFEAVPCPGLNLCMDGQCVMGACTPGAAKCFDGGSYEVCTEDGQGYGEPIPCGETEGCKSGTCQPLCEIVKADPSSVGCVFRANKMQNFEEEPSALIIGNVSEDLTATVQLYYRAPGGAEGPQGDPVEVLPGNSHVFNLTTPGEPGPVSVLRNGGTFRAESNIPVVAYQHSPINAEAHNDSSMLLPDYAQRSDYIVATYPPNLGGHPAYFNVIALEDDTTVEWTSPFGSSGGTGVPAAANDTPVMVTMQAGDMLQVENGLDDLSGTLIHSSKPIWVATAVQCVNIPANVTYCDHIEEQAIPLEYWGETYVGAHAPQRGNEDYHWRVFGGDEAVTIETDPPQAGFPVTLNLGDFHDFETSESFTITGDGPFMPVQFLEGQNGGAGTGDPAMYQMVPVEQFLDRYAFVTGTGYTLNYVQVIRKVNGPEVYVDEQTVTGYYQVGEYEVADWPISEGAHLATSAGTFGAIQVGYTGVTSYAYPGGLNLEVINPIG
ncbi:MAG: IgGFc-binding protein [Nannocystaceae bacterium]